MTEKRISPLTWLQGKFSQLGHKHNITDLNNVEAVNVTVTYNNNTTETIKLLKYTGS